MTSSWDTFWFGMILGAALLGVTLTFGVRWIPKIESQKEFIVGNATYQCTKTNELKTGNGDD